MQLATRCTCLHHTAVRSSALRPAGASAAPAPPAVEAAPAAAPVPEARERGGHAVLHGHGPGVVPHRRVACCVLCAVLCAGGVVSCPQFRSPESESESPEREGTALGCTDDAQTWTSTRARLSHSVLALLRLDLDPELEYTLPRLAAAAACVIPHHYYYITTTNPTSLLQKKHSALLRLDPAIAPRHITCIHVATTDCCCCLCTCVQAPHGWVAPTDQRITHPSYPIKLGTLRVPLLPPKPPDSTKTKGQPMNRKAADRLAWEVG